MHPRSWLRSVAILLATVLATGAVGGSTAAQDPGPTASAGPGALATLPTLSVPAEAELAADLVLEPSATVEAVDLGAIDMAAIRDGLLATVVALPPSDWTIAGLADAMDYDPVQPFLFVRDRIAFQPYAGVLRGPEGTLAARAGNSWDRALLLLALLDAMEVPARLAWGDLDAATAAALVVRGLEAPASTVPETQLPLLTGVDLRTVGTRARRDHAALRQALGARLATLAGDESAQATAEVGRHAWVQALVGPEWVDLDPSLPGAREGTTLTAAIDTGDAPPDDQVQAVQVTLVAEHLDPATGALSSSTVLDQRLVAATTAPEIVTLSFIPSSDQLGSTIASMFAGVQDWRPVLGVADQQFAGSGFAAGGTGTDIFGEEVDAPELTGLRLQFTSTGPGREPASASTVLLDRVRPAVRATGVVALEDLLPLPTDTAGPVVLSRITHVLLSTGDADAMGHAGELGAAFAFVNDVLLDPDLAEQQQLSDLLRPLMTIDDHLVMASELISVPALRDPGRVGAFVAAPRVYLATFGPADEPGRDLLRDDLVLDGVRLLADPAVAPAELAARRLWYGALQSAIETELIRERTASPDPSSVTLAAASYTTGAGMEVLDATAIGSRTDLPAALVDGLEAGGLAVVAAGATDPTTWWAIAPDGSTVAMLAPTYGGAYSLSGGRYTGVKQLPRVPRGQASGPGGVYDLSKPPRSPRSVPVGNTCRGGSEYTAILGCVSIPGALVFRIVLATAIDAVIFAVIWGAFKAVEAGYGPGGD